MISHTDNTHCGLHTTNAVIPSSSSVSSENNTRIEKTSPLGKQTVPTGQNQQRWAPKLYIGDLVNYTKVVVKIDSSVVPGTHQQQQRQQQAKVQLFSWKGLEFNRAQIQGTIVERRETINGTYITVKDSTGSIEVLVRDRPGVQKNLEVNHLVLVIGKLVRDTDGVDTKDTKIISFQGEKTGRIAMQAIKMIRADEGIDKELAQRGWYCQLRELHNIVYPRIVA